MPNRAVDRGASCVSDPPVFSSAAPARLPVSPVSAPASFFPSFPACDAGSGSRATTHTRRSAQIHHTMTKATVQRRQRHTVCQVMHSLRKRQTSRCLAFYRHVLLWHLAFCAHLLSQLPMDVSVNRVNVTPTTGEEKDERAECSLTASS